MKTKLSFALSLILVLCSSLLSCSDDGPNAPITNDNTPSVYEFLNSKYGMATLENHGLTIQNLDLDNAKKEIFKSKGVTSFSIPTVENGVVIGRLNAFIVPGNDPYRAIVEKWNKSNDTDYLVTVSTGYGAYLATIEVFYNGSKEMQNIIDISSNSRSNDIAEEGWWACTTRVYKTAKDACGNDSQCDFLCDIANLSGGCTISMAAAAAIACL